MPTTTPTEPTAAAARLARRLLGTRQMNHLVRFAPVLDAIEATGITSGGTLLDVGSGSLGIAALLRGWTVTMVDADFSDYGAAVSGQIGPRRVVGDVRELPFVDGAFDVVVAIDLLEHVAPKDRETAVHELCRVARRRAIIACPVGADGLEADRRVAMRLKRKGRDVPGWLAEHLDHGFPEVDALLAVAAGHGEVTQSGNESISAHERLVRAELSPPSAVGLRLFARGLSLLLASEDRRQRRVAHVLLGWLRGGDTPPTYRRVLTVDVGSEPRERNTSVE